MKNFTAFSFSLLIALKTISQTSNENVRGTWVTNVASEVLRSEKNIQEAVALCKQQGINNIYVVVWNKGLTMYPSKVLHSYIGINQDPLYEGFDPIESIVKEGHKVGLKVHAWFEFGFSYSYKDSSSIWLKKYPSWVTRNNKGQLLEKNGFLWWNALHPEVRKFMRHLILEVVAKYNIDGVQGDDRLPAMPSEGGYDDYTISLYKSQLKSEPSSDPKNKEWIQWRADQLSIFGKEIYNAVKHQKKDCIVSWAPSIYPWSKEQYLQDWPEWLKGGYADYIIPQLYRYNLNDYEKILKELNDQLSTADKTKVFPGMLTSLGNGYLIKHDMLQKMINLNRNYGFNGECLFYFETVKKLEHIYQ